MTEFYLFKYLLKTKYDSENVLYVAKKNIA